MVFWKNYADVYRNVSMPVRVYLTLRASSVPVGGLFSVIGKRGCTISTPEMLTSKTFNTIPAYQHKRRLRPESAPDSAGGAHDAPQIP